MATHAGAIWNLESNSQSTWLPMMALKEENTGRYRYEDIFCHSFERYSRDHQARGEWTIYGSKEITKLFS